jgi:hypothetical protein
MPENEPKKVTLRIPDDIHEQWRKKIFDLKTSGQAVLLEMAREWVNGKRQVPIPMPDPAKEKFSEDIGRLKWILANGTTNDRDWIRGNLKNFEEAISSRAAKKAASKHA